MVPAIGVPVTDTIKVVGEDNVIIHHVGTYMAAQTHSVSSKNFD